MKVTKKERKTFKSWTSGEKQIMTKCYAKEGKNIQKRLPNKTLAQIRLYAQAHNLKCNKKGGNENGGQSKKYTVQELKTVVRLYGKVPAKDIALEIGRSTQAIYSIAVDLGLTTPRKPFSEKEKIIMQYMYPLEGKDVAPRMEHDVRAIYNYAHRHGLKNARRSDKALTQSEVDVIEALYENNKVEFIADIVDRSKSAVYKTIKTIKKEKEMEENLGTKWTSEETNILMVNYSDPTKCAELLNRTSSAIESKARRLGLQ